MSVISYLSHFIFLLTLSVTFLSNLIRSYPVNIIQIEIDFNKLNSKYFLAHPSITRRNSRNGSSQGQIIQIARTPITTVPSFPSLRKNTHIFSAELSYLHCENIILHPHPEVGSKTRIERTVKYVLEPKCRLTLGGFSREFIHGRKRKNFLRKKSQRIEVG